MQDKTAQKMPWTLTPAHIRAARALLDWTREQLSEESGVPMRTLARIESGEGQPLMSTMDAIRATLESKGIVFLNHRKPGVRLILSSGSNRARM